MTCCAAKIESTQNKSYFDFLSDPKIYNCVKVISRIALAIFSASVMPFAFTISFSAGVLLGSAYAIYNNYPSEPAAKGLPVCAQGYAELLADTKFSTTVNLVTTAVFIASHIHCESLVFVPFTGLFIGFWAGKEGTNAIHAAINKYVNRMPLSCCM